MKTLTTIKYPLVLALALIVITMTPSVLACESPSDEVPQRGAWCAQRPVPAPISAAPARTVVAPATATPVANVRRGASPTEALEITGEWQTIEANANVWYKVDNGQNFYLDVWVDANGKSGLGLSVYSPEQTNNLSLTTPPKGRGTINGAPGHDLYWSGSQARGTWYALVTNSNASPVQYKIGSSRADADRNCVSYWEWIGKDLVWWTACR
jgi:hypothetical protein